MDALPKKLYAGTMNDGLFIIDRPPHPAPTDYISADTKTVVVAKMAGSDQRAQSILDRLVAGYNDLQAAQARIAELEAKLAEAHGALRDIAGSGPVNERGEEDAYAGWSWCYDRAERALASGGTEAAAVLEAAVAIADRLVERTEEDYRAATKLKDAVDALLAKRGRT